MSKITREMRQKALAEDYKNKGKSDRNWYMIDGDLMEETYGVKSFTPEEGSIFLAVLERWEDPKFFMEIFIHYNIGTDNHAFLCPDKMFGEPCPICAFRDELKTQGEPEDIYKEYRWTRRYLMWVVNTETKRTINQGVMIYDAPMTVKNGILDVCVNPRTGTIIDPSDASEKVNIVFKRIGKKGYQFTEYKGFKIEIREDIIPEEYLNLPEMKELLVEPDVSEMKKCLGIVNESSRRKEETEEDKTPVSKFKREMSKLVEEKEKSPARRLKREESVEEDEDKPRIPRRHIENEREKPLVSTDLPESEEDDDLPFDAKKYGNGNDEKDETAERQKVLEKTRERLRDRKRV